MRLRILCSVFAFVVAVWVFWVILPPLPLVILGVSMRWSLTIVWGMTLVGVLFDHIDAEEQYQLRNNYPEGSFKDARMYNGDALFYVLFAPVWLLGHFKSRRPYILAVSTLACGAVVYYVGGWALSFIGPTWWWGPVVTLSYFSGSIAAFRIIEADVAVMRRFRRGDEGTIEEDDLVEIVTCAFLGPTFILMLLVDEDVKLKWELRSF